MSKRAASIQVHDFAKCLTMCDDIRTSSKSNNAKMRSQKASVDDQAKGRHLLLGNGFSRACRNDIFSYDSLFEAADFKGLSEETKKTFEQLGTTDFEVVMRSLQNASKLIHLYTKDKKHDLAKNFTDDAEKLRKVLVNTIASNHPDKPSDIKDDEYKSCVNFLSNFEKIYTLNYDLLLYWTIMKEREWFQKERDDGFRDPFCGESEDYHEEEYVEWVNSNHSQNIHFLHGAIHLFYKEHSLQKYCWRRTEKRLLQQIDEALQAGRFPMIVAEGASNQKLERIQRSNYMGHNFRSLTSIGGSLFVFGHSLNDTDDHILKQIRKNRKLKCLFVSVFGDPNSAGNKQIMAKAQLIATDRPENKPLRLEFYQAESAKVWR